MKRITVAILMSLLFASIGHAQQSSSDAPASKEDIEKYFDVMHARDMLISMMDLMPKQMHQMIHEEVKNDPNLPPEFEARMDKMADDMFKELPIDDLLQAMVPAYEKHLTKGDVEALTAFYSTPTGQKILKQLPAITAEGMQAASGIVQKMVAKALDRVQSEIAQMQKESQGNAVQQPPPTSN